MIHSTLIQNDDLNDYNQDWILALSLLCIKYAKKVVMCRYLTFELRKMSWFLIREIAKKSSSQIAFSLSIGIADIIFFAKDNSAFYSNAWHWLYICLKLSLITDSMQYSKEYKLHLRTFFKERLMLWIWFIIKVLYLVIIRLS